MAIPREPRQKMINLMYLVLTALLALNVSSEVLNALHTINDSLTNATRSIEGKNQLLFGSFQDWLNNPKTHDATIIWYTKAQKAQQLSDDMYAYIEGIKFKLMRASGYYPEKGDSTYTDDDVDASTKIMDEGKVGDTLQQKLIAYRQNLLALDTAINKEFKNSLPIDLSKPNVTDKSNNTWSAAYFRMTPTIGAVTILSKFQSDIRNSEAQVVEFCLNEVGQVHVKYDEFEPLAMSNSVYYMPGQEMDITAGIGAFSKNARPTVTIDGSNVPIDPLTGIATYKSVAGSPGNYTKRVNISFTKPDGTDSTVTKDIQYTVGSPTGITISADAVRVLYIGLDNPISISGANGHGAEALHVSIDQGSITSSGGGKFVARVTTPGTAHIRVTDGKTQVVQDFRVRTVPTPIAMVGASKGGRMRLNEFQAQRFVRADLENFVFEGVKFTVTSFTITCTGAGFPEFMHQSVSGNTFDAVQDLIRRAKPGCTIVLDDIRASGPGGSRSLPPVAFNLF